MKKDIEEERRKMLERCFSEGAIRPDKNGNFEERQEYFRRKETEKHVHTSGAKVHFHNVLKRTEF